MKKCDCPYKGSCHEFREKNNSSIEDCIFFKMLKPMYEKRVKDEVRSWR